ncbi:hypothetical protein Q5741_18805 [Paenibacillus sp. JX-17]|uniref:Uncharacterized protein n=1 Tax=Paenibacillus lacisoli TaxID=3064525 RepID=A0ABT9CIM0_9BACL|nr:hypothetical protein [Paenibacillus sp. JX-17]MDO7908454.1 hypothetical protein [Paenibacillus sp. JX-17]
MAARKLDPFFQTRIKYTVVGEDGQPAGEVYLLDRRMLPKRETKGEGPHHEHIRQSRHGL